MTPGPPQDHQPQRGAGAPHRASQGHVEDPAPLLVGHVGQRRHAAKAASFTATSMRPCRSTAAATAPAPGHLSRHVTAPVARSPRILRHAEGALGDDVALDLDRSRVDRVGPAEQVKPPQVVERVRACHRQPVTGRKRARPCAAIAGSPSRRCHHDQYGLLMATSGPGVALAEPSHQRRGPVGRARPRAMTG